MKKAHLSNEAPAPIGPYSQAIQAGNTLYISGQIAINPSTNELITSNALNNSAAAMIRIK